MLTSAGRETLLDEIPRRGILLIDLSWWIFCHFQNLCHEAEINER